MERVNRLSRNLIYLLFVVVVVYLLSLRAERGKTIILGKWPLKPVVAGSEGVVLLKERGDGSQVLVIKLKEAKPQALVLVKTRDGLFHELGKLEGATFVMTLPKAYRFPEEMVAIRLVGPSGGRVLAETLLYVKQKESPHAAENP